MKTKILLIQTTVTLGNGTREYLEGRGYKVVWAGSGLSALMLARNIPLDVIMLDVSLPDIEGMDLCRLFRRRSETRHLPIILVTSRGYRPAQSSVPEQPDAYLEKPYTDIELDRIVAQVLAPKEPVPETSKVFETSRRSDMSGWFSPEPRHALITTRQQTLKLEPEPVAKNEAEEPERFGTDHEVWKEALPRPEPRKPAEHPAVDSHDTFSKWAETALKTGMEAHDAGPMQEAAAAKGNGDASPAQEAVAAKGTGDGGQEPASARDASAPDADHPILAFHGTGTAVIDQDTGLFGRAQFEAMLDKEFKRAIRFKQNMSVMLIDLDGRSRGQVADEALVKALIALVQKTIREVDTPAWWSGESFIVLLPNTSSTDALQAGARVLDAVALYPFSWPDATRITLNIGVAGLPNIAISNPAQLVECANAAMQRARKLMTPPPFKIQPRKK
jgi:diguanylate cyclase (GGDEF)-like protein